MTSKLEFYFVYYRLWTHGYDVYSPSEIVVAHDYEYKMPLKTASIASTKTIDGMAWSHMPGSPDQPRFLYDRALEHLSILYNNKQERDLTVAEIQELTYYNLGNKRTLQQFQTFIGLDISRKQYLSDR
jgi:hypothetical protein